MRARGDAAGRILLAGPWVGEFGWELMAFQGRLRELARRFDRTIVLTSQASHALYSDFAETVDPEIPAGMGAANGCHRSFPSDALRSEFNGWVRRTVARFRRQLESECPGVEITTYIPTEMPMFPWVATYRPRQRFVRYGVAAQPTQAPYVVLIRRNRNLASERNQSDAWWAEVSGRLEAQGCRVEFFVENLDAGLTQLASADLAAGFSTGGMHLASLCACPHFVVSDARKWSAGPWPANLKRRYTYIWNPLGTPVRSELSGWQQSAEWFAAQTEQALRRIGRRTGDRGTVLRWKILTWLPGRLRLWAADLAASSAVILGNRNSRKLVSFTAPDPND